MKGTRHPKHLAPAFMETHTHPNSHKVVCVSTYFDGGKKGSHQHIKVAAPPDQHAASKLCTGFAAADSSYRVTDSYCG